MENNFAPMDKTVTDLAADLQQAQETFSARLDTIFGGPALVLPRITPPVPFKEWLAARA